MELSAKTAERQRSPHAGALDAIAASDVARPLVPLEDLDRVDGIRPSSSRTRAVALLPSIEECVEEGCATSPSPSPPVVNGAAWERRTSCRSTLTSISEERIPRLWEYPQAGQARAADLDFSSGEAPPRQHQYHHHHRYHQQQQQEHQQQQQHSPIALAKAPDGEMCPAEAGDAEAREGNRSNHALGEPEAQQQQDQDNGEAGGGNTIFLHDESSTAVAAGGAGQPVALLVMDSLGRGVELQEVGACLDEIGLTALGEAQGGGEKLPSDQACGEKKDVAQDKEEKENAILHQAGGEKENVAYLTTLQRDEDAMTPLDQAKSWEETVEKSDETTLGQEFSEGSGDTNKTDQQQYGQDMNSAAYAPRKTTARVELLNDAKQNSKIADDLTHELVSTEDRPFNDEATSQESSLLGSTGSSRAKGSGSDSVVAEGTISGVDMTGARESHSDHTSCSDKADQVVKTTKTKDGATKPRGRDRERSKRSKRGDREDREERGASTVHRKKSLENAVGDVQGGVEETPHVLQDDAKSTHAQETAAREPRDIRAASSGDVRDDAVKSTCGLESQTVTSLDESSSDVLDPASLWEQDPPWEDAETPPKGTPTSRFGKRTQLHRQKPGSPDSSDGQQGTLGLGDSIPPPATCNCGDVVQWTALEMGTGQDASCNNPSEAMAKLLEPEENPSAEPEMLSYQDDGGARSYPDPTGQPADVSHDPGLAQSPSHLARGQCGEGLTDQSHPDSWLVLGPADNGEAIACQEDGLKEAYVNQIQVRHDSTAQGGADTNILPPGSCNDTLEQQEEGQPTTGADVDDAVGEELNLLPKAHADDENQTDNGSICCHVEGDVDRPASPTDATSATDTAAPTSTWGPEFTSSTVAETTDFSGFDRIFQPSCPGGACGWVAAGGIKLPPSGVTSSTGVEMSAVRPSCAVTSSVTESQDSAQPLIQDDLSLPRELNLMDLEDGQHTPLGLNTAALDDVPHILPSLNVTHDEEGLHVLPNVNVTNQEGAQDIPSSAIGKKQEEGPHTLPIFNVTHHEDTFHNLPRVNVTNHEDTLHTPPSTSVTNHEETLFTPPGLNVKDQEEGLHIAHIDLLGDDPESALVLALAEAARDCWPSSVADIPTGVDSEGGDHCEVVGITGQEGTDDSPDGDRKNQEISTFPVVDGASEVHERTALADIINQYSRRSTQTPPASDDGEMSCELETAPQSLTPRVIVNSDKEDCKSYALLDDPIEECKKSILVDGPIEVCKQSATLEVPNEKCKQSEAVDTFIEEGNQSELVDTHIEQCQQSELVDAHIEEGKQCELVDTDIEECKRSELVDAPIEEGRQGELVGALIEEEKQSDLLHAPIEEGKQTELVDTRIEESKYSELVDKPINEGNQRGFVGAPYEDYRPLSSLETQFVSRRDISHEGDTFGVLRSLGDEKSSSSAVHATQFVGRDDPQAPCERSFDLAHEENINSKTTDIAKLSGPALGKERDCDGADESVRETGVCSLVGVAETSGGQAENGCDLPDPGKASPLVEGTNQIAGGLDPDENAMYSAIDDMCLPKSTGDHYGLGEGLVAESQCETHVDNVAMFPAFDSHISADVAPLVELSGEVLPAIDISNDVPPAAEVSTDMSPGKDVICTKPEGGNDEKQETALKLEILPKENSNLLDNRQLEDTVEDADFLLRSVGDGKQQDFDTIEHLDIKSEFEERSNIESAAQKLELQWCDAYGQGDKTVTDELSTGEKEAVLVNSANAAGSAFDSVKKTVKRRSHDPKNITEEALAAAETAFTEDFKLSSNELDLRESMLGPETSHPREILCAAKLEQDTTVVLPPEVTESKPGDSKGDEPNSVISDELEGQDALRKVGKPSADLLQTEEPCHAVSNRSLDTNLEKWNQVERAWSDAALEEVLDPKPSSFDGSGPENAGSGERGAIEATIEVGLGMAQPVEDRVLEDTSPQGIFAASRVDDDPTSWADQVIDEMAKVCDADPSAEDVDQVASVWTAISSPGVVVRSAGRIRGRSKDGGQRAKRSGDSQVRKIAVVDVEAFPPDVPSVYHPERGAGADTASNSLPSTEHPGIPKDNRAPKKKATVWKRLKTMLRPPRLTWRDRRARLSQMSPSSSDQAPPTLHLRPPASSDLSLDVSKGRDSADAWPGPRHKVKLRPPGQWRRFKKFRALRYSAERRGSRLPATRKQVVSRNNYLKEVESDVSPVSRNAKRRQRRSSPRPPLISRDQGSLATRSTPEVTQVFNQDEPITDPRLLPDQPTVRLLLAPTPMIPPPGCPGTCGERMYQEVPGEQLKVPKEGVSITGRRAANTWHDEEKARASLDLDKDRANTYQGRSRDGAPLHPEKVMTPGGSRSGKPCRLM